MRKINIIQGEHAVVSEPGVVISTLLGSCIAVCLHDGVARLGGMNHFLLGDPGEGHKLSPSDLQRYGVHAMEVLINALMKKGAVRGRLKAHVYGGATMVAGLGPIGTNNAAFARRFLETEGIGIVHFDLGGASARKIEFIPFEGKTRCVRVSEMVPLAPVRALAPAAAGGELELF